MTEKNFIAINGASYLNLDNDQIFLGNVELRTSTENFILQSEASEYYDYLIFMDSRGAKVEENFISSIYLLRNYFEKMELSYLIVSRPLNLTTIATLLSFIENTIIKFGSVITNVGFVDTTPKKKDTLLDIHAQLVGAKIGSKYQSLGRFNLSNGIDEELGAYSISKSSIHNISQRFKKIRSKFYFINTPEVIINKSFKRQRPKFFYSQINK